MMTNDTNQLILNSLNDIKADIRGIKTDIKELQKSDNEIKQQLTNSVNEIRRELISTTNEMRQELSESTSGIKERLIAIETRIDEQKNSIGKIPDLAEKVGELKNWRQIEIIVITGTVGTFLGWFAKSGRL